MPLRPAVWSGDAIAARVAVAVAAAWAIVLLADFGAVLAHVYSDRDIVSAPVIGELYGEAHGSQVVLGYLPWYTALWFELLTRWLPFHREVWELAPWVCSVAAVAIVAWATAKAAGRWAGWMVAFMLVCAGPRLLTYQFAWSQHAATAQEVCLLDGFLVLLVSRGGRLGRRWVHAAACTLVAAVTAAGAASDKLLFVAGIVPFVAVGLALALAERGVAGRRVGGSVAAVGLGGLVGSRLVLAAMHAENVYASPFFSIRFATWDELGANVRLTAQGLASLFNGDFGGEALRLRSLLTLACSVLVAVGVFFAGRVGRAWARDARDRLRARGAAPPTDRVRFAHVGFWLSSLVLVLLALLLASFSDSLAFGAGRYLLAPAAGLPVLVAVAAAGRGVLARTVVVGCACAVVVAATLGLALDIRSNPEHVPTQAFARQLETFAEGEGLKYGYAAYIDAPALTWDMHARVQVYPVQSCEAPHGLCVFAFHRIDAWYRPRPATRTFLLVDHRWGPPDPGETLGGPDEVVNLGDYRVYVYDYDIASNFGPAVPNG